VTPIENTSVYRLDEEGSDGAASRERRLCTPGSRPRSDTLVSFSMHRLVPGATLGPYEIQSALGAGGMGEVYKAIDPRLGRVVAIKVLPADMAGDPQRRERFAREARVISSLNHPHICALYDVGRAEQLDFLVMEYLDGETLADRLVDSRFNSDAMLSIARQIAEALEAAHDKGIVHRDLKPSNVMIAADDQVKVLDFGLATHADPGTRPDVSKSPTVMVTSPGVVLGTAAYMSPEQANGKEADRSSDVWAFGCVIFEMLTGHRAFDGDTVSEIIANVLKTEPAWQRLPAGTPDGVVRLLRRSLQKDRRLRLRDVRDWRLELMERQTARPDDAPVFDARPARAERIAWLTALGIVALIAGALGLRAFRPASVAPEIRLELNTAPTGNSSVAISPDGQRIAFVAESAGQPLLWLRSLDSALARPLPGTERASRPFWSPDSRSIAFIADTRLKRVELEGGSAQTLATGIPVALGGGWSSDGTILFGNNPGGPIFRVSAQGGDVVAATRVGAPQQRGHMYPSFLPDRRHFVFFVTGSPEAQGVYIGQLNSFESTRLIAADGPAVYTVGHLLFIRDGKLMAQPFDPDRLALAGGAYAVADGVAALTVISVSNNGAIVYRTPSPDSGQRQIEWVDRTGRETDKVVYADGSALGGSLSHDGRRVAVYRYQNANMDIWSFDTSRRAWDRITFQPGDDIYPLFSRDGASIISGSVRSSTVVDLYRTFLNGQREELLVSSPLPKFPMDWSADGRFLLYDVLDPKRGFDIWVLPLDGQRRPSPLVETDFNEGLAQFSPDGRWIAYQSDRTGRTEIYLRPFGSPGADVRVSVDGGAQVRWNPNATELFYVTIDSRLMAVPIRFSRDGGSADPGAPRELFKTILSSAAGPTYKQQYMVSPDGQSFVMQSAIGERSPSPIGVILNWKPRPQTAR
jgi:serine/threonine protein kinase